MPPLPRALARGQQGAPPPQLQLPLHARALEGTRTSHLGSLSSRFTPSLYSAITGQGLWPSFLPSPQALLLVHVFFQCHVQNQRTPSQRPGERKHHFACYKTRNNAIFLFTRWGTAFAVPSRAPRWPLGWWCPTARLALPGELCSGPAAPSACFNSGCSPAQFIATALNSTPRSQQVYRLVLPAQLVGKPCIRLKISS